MTFIPKDIQRPDHDAISEEFRREAPYYLNLAELTVRKSYFQFRAFLRKQTEPWPTCFTRESIIAFMAIYAGESPHHRDKAKPEPSSVNDLLKGLRRVSRWAVARGYIPEDVTKGIKKRTERDRMMFAPSRESVGKVLDEVKSYGLFEDIRERNYAMLLLLTDTGMRTRELLGINLADVYREGEIADSVIIKGKGNVDRQAPISEVVGRQIERYLSVRRVPNPGEKALWIDRSGKRMEYEAIRNLLQKVGKRVGVKVRLHDFRRFCLTEMWLAGINQIDGMILSGHRRADVYQRYIRAAMQQRAVAMHRTKSPLALMGRTS